MFKKLAHRGLMARLVSQHGVNEGVAYALATACYPSRKQQLPFDPVTDSSEAARRVDYWERTQIPSVEELCTLIFGEQNVPELERFVQMGAFLKDQGY